MGGSDAYLIESGIEREVAEGSGKNAVEDESLIWEVGEVELIWVIENENSSIIHLLRLLHFRRQTLLLLLLLPRHRSQSHPHHSIRIDYVQQESSNNHAHSRKPASKSKVEQA